MSQLIKRFIEHDIAANLLMIAILVSGTFVLSKLNRQFLPNFQTQQIIVQATWLDTNAQEIERAVIIPMEEKLKGINNLKSITSIASANSARINLEFKQHTNMTQAIDTVNDRINQINDLPKQIKNISIQQANFYERIAKIVLTGKHLDELVFWAKKAQDDLLKKGIDKIDLDGMAEHYLAIEIPSAMLYRLRLSIGDLRHIIQAQHHTGDAGSMGSDDQTRQLRTTPMRKTIEQLNALTIVHPMGTPITLGHIAKITKKNKTNAMQIKHGNDPALHLTLYRSSQSDTLNAAGIIASWIKQYRRIIPSSMKLHVYNEQFELLVGRIHVLLRNGAGGFILVLLLLFIFLHPRIALWIALGIPIAFAASLVVLWALGKSINMISLFAFIMTLGIIVDDTIVVGEQAVSAFENSGNPTKAVICASNQMFAPIIASSLTTIFAFLPLLLIGGVIGQVLIDIPIVVICVIIASLIECFLVLPGHLRSNLHNINPDSLPSWRVKLDAKIDHFRWVTLKRWLEVCMSNAYNVIACAMAFVICTGALLASGRIAFTFFPLPNSNMIWLDARFIPGTSKAQMDDFLVQSKQALQAAQKDLSAHGQLVEHVVSFNGKGNYPKGKDALLASMQVQITKPDARDISNQTFIDTWRSHMRPHPAIAQWQINQPQGGPPGQDIEIRLSNDGPIEKLQASIQVIKSKLATYPGVQAISDDMALGNTQWQFTLRPQAIVNGLNQGDILNQISSALTGRIIDTFYENHKPVDIRVQLDEQQRDRRRYIESLPIIANDHVYPLTSLVQWTSHRALDVITRIDSQRSILIKASVDRKQNNANAIIADLKRTVLPAVKKQWQSSYHFKGRQADQQKTLGDMKKGIVLALFLIYITLAWVANGYYWPLVLLLILPIGLMGGLLGHWVFSKDITLLSLFGFFGLCGIILNDGIILLLTFQRLREQFPDGRQAIIQAACQRFRPVLLTSLTTIGGLLPLLFERSTQAQFLIPMAITLIFGLLVTTVLIIFFLPCIIAISQDFHHWIQKINARCEL